MNNLNIEQLQEKYRKALFDKFLPNMDEYVIDHELGGFMCSVNILTRELASTNK